ncbi:MAG: hybrid sensor histidine kinase/response regulator [Deltaproteobacteria bacterium]|nr:hybrid sensor histidine kinase/response regulator [Deltaproteobacteria bacterium]
MNERIARSSTMYPKDRWRPAVFQNAKGGSPAMTAPPRVLIVDDEARNLSLLEALLAPLSLTTVRAAGGREAIELYQAEQARGGFDLVLLDVMMPEVDGLTALAAMREATPAGERIPIVLVTALGAREDRLRGLEAGADDFLTKPLDPHEVRCRVRTFLALRAAQKTLSQRAAELERLQRERAELSRMLVHDLKNPLAALDSNLSWISRRVDAKVDEQLGEAVDDSRASAARLLALVGGLVEIDRAETGQLAPVVRPVGIEQLLESVARRHRREAELRGISVDVDVDASLEGELDESLMVRAVENLVENATRYAGRGGRIQLEAKASGDALTLSVSNTGTPIAAASRATIFEKFVTSERRGHHQGLGLYLCRLVAEAHGGGIALHTDDAWPTRFTITLPIARKQPVVRRAARVGAFAPDDADLNP